MPVASCRAPDASAAAAENPNAQAIARTQAGPLASQTPDRGVRTQSCHGLHATHGKDPVNMPCAGLLTSPAVQAVPSAMPSMMGGHGMVYVLGIGLVPVVPCMAPGWNPSLSASTPSQGNQSASGNEAASKDQAASMPTKSKQPAASQAAAASQALGQPTPHPHPCNHHAVAFDNPPRPNPGLAQSPHAASAALTAAMAAAMAVAPARVGKSFPQLSSFTSLESLYEVVTHGDPVSGTLSFSAMAQLDPWWRKGLSRRYFELDSAVREMTERAEAESNETGLPVSP